jgi:hypothetical protein
MTPNVIVMIVTLSLPNGDSGVHVKPVPTVERCVADANIEASDPFVLHVECARLEDGRLELRFERKDDGTPIPAADSPRASG